MTESINILSATYRVVTPMFLSGADQDHAELRLPSFKGALRFWWRALAAQRFGNDIGALRAAEDTLFGSTRTGVSRVRMRLSKTNVKTSVQAKFRHNSWQSYVGYGLIDKPGQTQRQYFQPGSTFTVQLACARCNDAQRGQLIDAVIALGLLGGLGSRARNGWGSLTLQALDGDAQSWRAPTTADALRAELNRRFKTTSQPTSWSAFSAQSLFSTGAPQENSEAAHQWLATCYQEAVKSLAGDKPRREAFGLPRIHAGSNAQARRASPVILHIHQPEGEKAIPLALCVPSAFLPQEPLPSGNWQAVTAFVERIAHG